MHVLRVRDFTWDRARNILVAEQSDLEPLIKVPRGSFPSRFTVRGERREVDYSYSPADTVWDGGREDVIARVYRPTLHGGLPVIHVLND